jgi:two-component system chemotaxis response regulator CheB
VTVRVLVVDDSRTSRVLLSEVLDADPGIEVVGHAENGLEGLRLVAQLRPSLVLMDVRMRGLDGFEATERIMASHPTPIVIVTAGHDARDVQMGMRALRAGALTILAKPGGPGTASFAREAAHLRSLVHALADVRVVRRRTRTVARPGGETGRPLSPERTVAAISPERTVAAIGIAVSTGGPVALQRFLTALPTDMTVPVLVVQHIADGFTQGLVDWLSSGTGLDVRLAVDGQRVRPGTVFLAPDDRHLTLGPHDTLAVSNGPPVRRFRPSGDVLLRSLAHVLGPQAAAVVLTGMGSDGLDGARAVHAAGGLVLAQDEATSAVYGMPKAVVDAGLANKVGSASELAYVLASLLAKGNSP